MRVAMAASEYPPYVFGGLGTHVYGLSTELARQDVQVELFVPARDGYHAAPAGVRLHPVPTMLPESDVGTRYWIEFGREAARIASGLQPFDVIHCHDWMTAVAGSTLRAKLGVPLAFSVHLPQLTHPHVELELLGLTVATCNVVYSQAVRKELDEHYHSGADFAVLRNGMDTVRYRPPEAGHRAGGHTILFVGRLVEGKGVDVLLRAFAALLARLPDARLVMAGDGDDILLLQRLARFLGLPPRAEFAGWRTGDDLIRLYQAADAVVVPSHYEPFGLVAVEAMACGRPVIASDTGGLAEIIADGQSGLLFPPGDHLALARQLYRVLADERTWLEMSAAARARSLFYSWPGVATEARDFYQAVISKQGAGTLNGHDLLEVLLQLLAQGARPTADQLLESLLP